MRLLAFLAACQTTLRQPVENVPAATAGEVRTTDGVFVANVPSGTFDTPYGTVDGRTASAACHASEVRIGEIVDVETYQQWFTDDLGERTSSSYFSKLTFDAQAVLRGPPVSQFTVYVRGGLVNGEHVSTSRYEPQPIVGRRYALALNPQFSVPGSPLDVPEGTPSIQGVVSLPPALTLPPLADLQQQLSSWCSLQDFSQ